jgi:hypothetical protein
MFVCATPGFDRVTPLKRDADQAIAGFHATRVDWFYPGSVENGVSSAARQFIERCHAKAMRIGGAMHTNTTNAVWGLRPDKFAGRYLADPFDSGYVAAAVRFGKAQIDAGVDTLLYDDFFYYDSREKREFEKRVVKPIRAHRSGFAVAANHGGWLGTDYVKNYAFDFHYSDSGFEPKPSAWWNASKQHRAERSALLIHPNIALNRWDYRRQIALGYAVGAHVIMPWDRYIHGGERSFSKAADYADVTAFARALGQHGYLDRYEDAAVGGYDLRESRYPVAPLAVIGGNQQLSLFARAIPGRADAPVVVHLVRWANGGGSRVRLHTASFFGGQPLEIELWTRKPYNASQHASAQKRDDFESLIWNRTDEMRVEVNGPWTAVTVPELHPWGVLIVRNEKAPRPGYGRGSSGEWAKNWARPSFMDVGDVNGDGRADLVRGFNSGSDKLDIYVNLSTGERFGSGGVWGKGWLRPDFFSVADLNGDGRADVVRGFKKGHDKLSIYVNFSTGRAFGDGGTWASSWVRPRWLDAGDVDGDGYADLIRGSATGNDALHVTINVSTGHRFAWWRHWVSGWARPRFLDTADVDGDGRADLIRGFDSGTNKLNTHVSLSTGTRFIDGSTWAKGWARPRFLRSADVNGDGFADLVRGFDSPNNSFTAYVNLSTGTRFR